MYAHIAGNQDSLGRRMITPVGCTLEIVANEDAFICPGCQFLDVRFSAFHKDCGANDA